MMSFCNFFVKRNDYLEFTLQDRFKYNTSKWNKNTAFNSSNNNNNKIDYICILETSQYWHGRNSPFGMKMDCNRCLWKIKLCQYLYWWGSTFVSKIIKYFIKSSYLLFFQKWTHVSTLCWWLFELQQFSAMI